jgi:hypothetical protein
MKGRAMEFVICLLALYALIKFAPRDDTDSPTGERSGLVLYTDYGPGMQYISGGLFGGLTPRLDEHGKHMRAVMESAK